MTTSSRIFFLENARTSDRLEPSKRLIQRGRGRIEDTSFPALAQQLGDRRFLIRPFCNLPLADIAPRPSRPDGPKRPVPAGDCERMDERMDDRMVTSPQHKLSGFVDAAEGAG